MDPALPVEPFSDFTERIVHTLDSRESLVDFELRTRDHIIYCEHGTPLGQRCFACEHPEALLALTETH